MKLTFLTRIRKNVWFSLCPTNSTLSLWLRVGGIAGPCGLKEASGDLQSNFSLKTDLLVSLDQVVQAFFQLRPRVDVPQSLWAAKSST